MIDTIGHWGKAKLKPQETDTCTPVESNDHFPLFISVHKGRVCLIVYRGLDEGASEAA